MNNIYMKIKNIKNYYVIVQIFSWYYFNAKWSDETHHLCFRRNVWRIKYLTKLYSVGNGFSYICNHKRVLGSTLQDDTTGGLD